MADSSLGGSTGGSRTMDMHQIASFLSQISAIQAHIAKTSNPVQDPTNAYFLHPSENPGIPITTVVLTGQNYSTWSREMWRSFKLKNKTKFVDGSITKPESIDPLFEIWERCNIYVIGWINLSLSPDIRQSVTWNNLASDLWLDMKQCYYQGDRYRVGELYEELYTLRQGELDVTSYYTKLKTIWEEIDNFRQIPSCECGITCQCDLGVIRSQREEDRIVKFLRGLNEQYSNVRSQIMLLDKLPSLNVVLSKLTQQERQFLSLETTSDIQILAAPTNSLNTAMPSQGRGRGRSRGGKFQAGERGRGGRTRMQCSFCDKTGHAVDTCYKKHGLPPHLRQRNTNSAPAMMNCFNIGEETEESNDDLGFNHPQLEEKKTTGSDFTPEQKEALLGLLNKQEVQHIHSVN
ncbi:uncharacterized protein LOC107640819 [Arachis ipaensis]|uniref:uncharacterized protein LOC107640819 n=1 Tax=Arachis ipaensis TaxID=130454 RepID=UPI0007AF7B79|nr:uncharacterized protein LOC107640819 [Arachis ipaensis]